MRKFVLNAKNYVVYRMCANL